MPELPWQNVPRHRNVSRMNSPAPCVQSLTPGQKHEFPFLMRQKSDENPLFHSRILEYASI
jgi:hypothetical protein